jgi:hypothetical protein
MRKNTGQDKTLRMIFSFVCGGVCADVKLLVILKVFVMCFLCFYFKARNEGCDKKRSVKIAGSPQALLPILSLIMYTEEKPHSLLLIKEWCPFLARKYFLHQGRVQGAASPATTC